MVSKGGALAAVVCGLWLCAGTAWAQQPLPSHPIPVRVSTPGITADQQQALEDWLSAMKAWLRFDERWHNRVAHGRSGAVIARRPQPVAPAWVQASCGQLSPDETAAAPGQLGDACRLLAGLASDATAAELRRRIEAKRADSERPVKGSFFSRVHLDGLWSTTSSDVRYYGLIGTHISLVDVGRIQFFGPPGVILLSLPDPAGGRTLRPGYTWGMSVRLGDFHLPGSAGSGKNVTLFLNLTKCWVFGTETLPGVNMSGFDIAGFSIAPRRR